MRDGGPGMRACPGSASMTSTSATRARGCRVRWSMSRRGRGSQSPSGNGGLHQARPSSSAERWRWIAWWARAGAADQRRQIRGSTLAASRVECPAAPKSYAVGAHAGSVAQVPRARQSMVGLDRSRRERLRAPHEGNERYREAKRTLRQRYGLEPSERYVELTGPPCGCVNRNRVRPDGAQFWPC